VSGGIASSVILSGRHAHITVQSAMLVYLEWTTTAHGSATVLDSKTTNYFGISCWIHLLAA